MGFDISGLESWFLDQAEGIFIIGFILFIALAIFKRSIGALISIILIGGVIAMFVFFPETIQEVGSGIRNLLSSGGE